MIFFVDADKDLTADKVENGKREAVEYADGGKQSQHIEDIKSFQQIPFEEGAEIIKRECQPLDDGLSEISHSRGVEKEHQYSETKGEEQRLFEQSFAIVTIGEHEKGCRQ